MTKRIPPLRLTPAAARLVRLSAIRARRQAQGELEAPAPTAQRRSEPRDDEPTRRIWLRV